MREQGAGIYKSNHIIGASIVVEIIPDDENMQVTGTKISKTYCLGSQHSSCGMIKTRERRDIVDFEVHFISRRKPFMDNARTISKNTLVGQLVAEHPLCACILEKHAIDYCCGGGIMLEDACKKRGLNVDEIIEELIQSDLNKSPSSELDWTKTSLKELIEHILVAYHDPLRLELKRILPMAEKVAKVHGENHPEMTEVLNIFSCFKEQLELHMQKEEMILFPTIASMESREGPQSFGCGGGIEHPIAVMMREHEDAGEAMSAMNRLTNSYTPPEDACNTFKVLLHSLARIESEMHQHVHKENNILFPRAISLFGTPVDKSEGLTRHGR